MPETGKIDAGDGTQDKDSFATSRVALCLAAALVGLFGALNLMTPTGHVDRVLVLRGLALAALLGPVFIIARDTFTRHARHFLAHGGAIAGGALVLIALNATEPGLPYCYTEMLLFLLAFTVLFPLPLRLSICIAILMATGWLLAVLYGFGPGNMPLYAIGLSSALGIGGIVAWQREHEASRAKAHRKALEQKNIELDWMRERAQSADRAKSDFLATMSHEIRTPLNGVLGTARLLLRKGGLARGVKGALERIERSGELLRQMIDDVLDIAAIEAGKNPLEKLRFDLLKTLGDTLDMVRPLAQERGLDLALHVDNAIPHYLVGDRARLRQVLLNLVGNAIKFTRKGHVKVTVEPLSLTGETTRLRFTIEDTGSGIAKDELDTIFEPMARGGAAEKGSHGSTGLGLAIASRLVSEMEGQISVTSRKGKGSTFIFDALFDVADDQESKSPQTSTPASTASNSNLHLLLVEDEPANLHVARGLLELEGHSVTPAETGAEAIALVKQNRFDAILLDMRLPDMGGLEVAARLRAMKNQQATPPIIAVSANILASDVNTWLTSGIDLVVPKPIDPDRLASALYLATGDKPGDKKSSKLKVTPPAAFEGPEIETILASFEPSRTLSLLGELETAITTNRKSIGLAIGNGDLGKAADHAHRLAGAAGCYGLQRLASAGADLETHLRSADEGPVPAVLQKELKASSTQALKAVRSLSRELRV